MKRKEYLNIKLDIFKDIRRAMSSSDNPIEGLNREIYLLERTIEELDNAETNELINKCIKTIRGGY